MDKPHRNAATGHHRRCRHHLGRRRRARVRARGPHHGLQRAGLGIPADGGAGAPRAQGAGAAHLAHLHLLARTGHAVLRVPARERATVCLRAGTVSGAHGRSDAGAYGRRRHSTCAAQRHAVNAFHERRHHRVRRRGAAQQGVLCWRAAVLACHGGGGDGLWGTLSDRPGGGVELQRHPVDTAHRPGTLPGARSGGEMGSGVVRDDICGLDGAVQVCQRVAHGAPGASATTSSVLCGTCPPTR